ncbi:MAG: outer membrane protein assembly factor BamD [Tepidisphaeraceae bacterium]
MAKPLLLCIMALLLSANAARGAQSHTWELREGRWREATRPATGPAVPEPMLDRAEELLRQQDPKAAKKILLAWEKGHKKSPARDRCIFLLVDVFYQQDDRFKSFFYCDELMDEYPESKLFQAALQKQFDIANAYLNGYKDTFLGMRIVDESAEAVQMMWRIQQRAPGSPLAERGLLYTADYYYSDSDYDLAEDAYNFYAQSYPNSDRVPQVKLRAAFSSLAQFRGVKFDATHIIDARAQLLVIQKLYPELAAEENVQTVIDQIDSAFAKKLLDQGEFYQRTGELHGAVYQYRFLAQTYPNAPEAWEARDHLSRMPASVLAEAPPPRASGYAPATEPSVDAGGR